MQSEREIKALLLDEAALDQPGVGMPESVYDMARAGWVSAVDERLEQSDIAWSLYFLLLRHAMACKLKADDC